MDEKDKHKIKDGVQQSFIEIINNTISEKISYCMSKGMSEDNARHTVIQVVKNLPDHLLPMKIISQEEEEDDCSDENIKRFARFIVS
ncbi:MAG: hypothetical protein UT90_C0021G0005 [Parcubacteria group bacterium GW2011_GWA1_40_21]|nr:MAG: hypothetical protein UT90_C0021G0005 [Parcubacteria group bacterium GW2011_GWA1_40_21]